jgi:methylated-DNA-[protein]-cysteine S-methyltransferase
MDKVIYTHVATPIGQLLAARGELGLTAIHFERNGTPAEPRDEWQRDDSAFADVREQFRAYFARELTAFDLKLAPRGTPFQLDVWGALRTIRYGETRSYAQLARMIGRENAVRAVGAANGANPLPIVIPCHRVIGSNGSLTGFGGGIAVKRFLLDLELYVRSA